MNEVFKVALVAVLGAASGNFLGEGVKSFIPEVTGLIALGVGIVLAVLIAIVIKGR